MNHPKFGSKSIPDPMNTPPQTRRIPPTGTSKGDTVVGFAIVGFLLAGAVGLVKAMGMIVLTVFRIETTMMSRD